MANKLLNFRCPEELLAAIDEIGRDRYPVDNAQGCDRSKTLLDLLQAGIQALKSGSVEIPISSKTSKTDGKTLTSAEVEEIVAAAFSLVQAKLEAMDQRLGELSA